MQKSGEGVKTSEHVEWSLQHKKEQDWHFLSASYVAGIELNAFIHYLVQSLQQLNKMATLLSPI